MLYTIYLAQQIIALIEFKTALFSSRVAAGALRLGTERSEALASLLLLLALLCLLSPAPLP